METTALSGIMTQSVKPELCDFNIFWVMDQVLHDDLRAFYGFTRIKV